MKKITPILMLIVGIGLIVSCGKKLTPDTPEDEVRNYGIYFVEKVNAGQLDSLKATYPDIDKADSIVRVKSDTIMVVESAPGQYDMTLAEGITLKVTRSEDGNISITESKGLFAFPADNVDLAKKTGMWDDKLSDVQLNERMKDEEFFTFINQKKKNMEGSKIKITPNKMIKKDYPYAEAWYTTMTIMLTNTSNTPISGNDYLIEYKCDKSNGSSDDSWKRYTTTRSAKGIDLKPTESGKINLKEDNVYKFYDFKVLPAKGKETVLKNQFSPSGKEYQEYLDSKK